MRLRYFFLPVVFSLWVMGFLTLSPLLVLRLSHNGASPSAIGIFSALSYFTILLLTPWLGTFTQRFSVRTLFLFGAWLELACILSFTLSDHLFWWYAAALTAGIGGALVWSLSESMIVLDAPAHWQGQYMGIYQTIMGSAFALGPTLAANTPWGFATTLYVLVAFMSALLLLLMAFYHWPSVRREDKFTLHTVALGDTSFTDVTLPDAAAIQPAHNSQFKSMLRFAFISIPLLLIAALVGGTFEAGLDSMGIVAGLEFFNEKHVLYLPAVTGLGSLLMQYPLGRLADRIGAGCLMRWMLGILVAVCMVFALGYQHYPWLIWILSPMWGACGGTLYTLAMTMISKQSKDTSLVAMTSLLVACYTTGGMLGPVLGGFSYQIGGSVLLGLAFAAMAGLGWGFALRNSKSL